MAKKNKTVPALPRPSASGIGTFFKGWAYRNRSYLMAFFIPVILTYISYAIFGLYPFGKESVLALDLNAQYVYYFEALRDAFWGDGSIFYSWSRNLSGEFMGIIGYYLASPFTFIVLLLPQKFLIWSLLIMILCKIGTASVTFCYYLQKSKKLPPMQALTFSLMYAMMAYMIIQTIDPMWLDGLVFLPLVALGVEYLIDDGRKINYIIPLALMFVANFYIGYMIGIFTACYFIYYLFFGTEQKRLRARDFVLTGCRFCISTIVSVMCAAGMLLPTVKALSLGKFDFTANPDYSFKVQFEPFDILAQMLVGQYDTVNVQGSPEIYCGILTLVLLPVFFLNSRIDLRKKMGAGFLLCVLFFSMYIKPVDMWWHGGQVPNWLPYRYSFILSFVLLGMAATALQHLDGLKVSYLGGIFFGILGGVLYLDSLEYEHLDIMTSIWISIGLAAVYCLLLYVLRTREGRARAVSTVMFLVICGELVFNAVYTMRDVDKDVAYSEASSYVPFVQRGRAAVDALEAIDDGFYRSEKTYVRCVNDNLAFGLRGLTHSSSVMNAKTLDFIETMGYCTRSYYSRYDGTTELADSLLGIRYVLDNGDRSLRSLLHDSYTQVGTYTYKDTENAGEDELPEEKTIGIYENPDALSIAYMVSEDLTKIDHLGNDNPFNSQNILLSTMLGQTVFDAQGQIAGFSEYYNRIDTGEPILGAVTVSEYNQQACYTKMETGDPTVDYRFTVTDTKEIYCFLKTENEQRVNLWLGTWDEELGDYNFEGFGTYFDTKNYCILSLGSYEPGTQVALRLTVNNDQNATIIKEPFFYYFDEAKFRQDIAGLRDGQLSITKASDTRIQGTVTAQAGELLFTSIPYEEGWTVKVDGRKVEPVKLLNAMMGVKLTPGEHTVTFTYTAPGFVPGMVLVVLGIGAIVVLYRYDRKNNKVLLAAARAARRTGRQA